MQVPRPPPVTAMNLTAGGATATLVSTVNPADAINKNVIWSSSDESVATVHANSPAVVTPVGEGTAVITVTTEDGSFTSECAVTVVLAAQEEEEEEELPRTGGSHYYGFGLLTF